MNITEFSKKYHEKMFPGSNPKFLETDPELIERFNNFAYDEVINQTKIDDKTRFTVILAALIGCGGIDAYKEIVPAALNYDVTPVEIKEIVYQANAYLGMGRVFPYLKATNEIFDSIGIKLPLEGQSNTTVDNRLEKGIKTQVEIFGSDWKDFYKRGPEDTKHINRWLAANCFGDYYTRSGLDYKQREMITFCFLVSQGGCEPQAVSHAKANIKIGNDKDFLIAVVSSILPYIGYPRSLNAISCIRKACEE
ncbi:MAG: carboxymuconolactone decarboxylase family protein [Bacteroidetes bacterium]|nr:carboxymuconolactone decarboxylase family protein [Bacteroidota bacterium]